MARLNATWFNFTRRGQAWDHFWQDSRPPNSGSLTADALLEKTGSGSFAAAANLLRSQVGSFTADAAMDALSTHPGWFTADAEVGTVYTQPGVTNRQRHNRYTDHSGVDGTFTQIVSDSFGPYYARETTLHSVLVDLDARITARERHA